MMVNKQPKKQKKSKRESNSWKNLNSEQKIEAILLFIVALFVLAVIFWIAFL